MNATIIEIINEVKGWRCGGYTDDSWNTDLNFTSNTFCPYCLKICIDWSRAQFQPVPLPLLKEENLKEQDCTFQNISFMKHSYSIDHFIASSYQTTSYVTNSYMWHKCPQAYTHPQWSLLSFAPEETEAWWGSEINEGHRGSQWPGWDRNEVCLTSKLKPVSFVTSHHLTLLLPATTAFQGKR